MGGAISNIYVDIASLPAPAEKVRGKLHHPGPRLSQYRHRFRRRRRRGDSRTPSTDRKTDSASRGRAAVLTAMARR